MTPALRTLLQLIREDCRPVCRDGLDLIEEYIVALERRCEVLTLLVPGDTHADSKSPPNPEKADAPSAVTDDGRAGTSNNIIPIGHSVKVPDDFAEKRVPYSATASNECGHREFAWRVDGGSA